MSSAATIDYSKFTRLRDGCAYQGVCSGCNRLSYLVEYIEDEWDITSARPMLCICCAPDEIDLSVLPVSSSMGAEPPPADTPEAAEAALCKLCTKMRCSECAVLGATHTCRLCFTSMCGSCHAHVHGFTLCFGCADKLTAAVADLAGDAEHIIPTIPSIAEEEIPW